MTTYKCYIIDDEPLALNIIEQHVSRFPQMVISGKTTEPRTAITQLKALQPHLLFLDIEMPEMTGLELLAAIRNKPEVIITTAYRDFAVEGFEHDVLDYLVKPVSFQRFARAMDKFFEKHSKPETAIHQPSPDILLVKAERKTLRIELNRILYIEGVKDYVRIVTPTERILTKVTIGKMLTDLPADRFIQVHKSFIVAKDKITAYTAHDVEIGSVEIPIGRMYKEEVIRVLGEE